MSMHADMPRIIRLGVLMVGRFHCERAGREGTGKTKARTSASS